jgi:gluconate kinase
MEIKTEAENDQKWPLLVSLHRGVKFERRNGTKITALNCTNLINNYLDSVHKSHPNTLLEHTHIAVSTRQKKKKKEKFIKHQGPR